MKDKMQDYYQYDREIKSRLNIKQANRLKRWNSGRAVIKNIIAELRQKSPLYLH
jgi:hypothetical protein